MPNPAGVPEPNYESETGHTLLSSISREMVRAMKSYYGKGPVRAKSYFLDDLLFVALRGGTTVAEVTMLEAGHQDEVRRFRQVFANEMAERLIGTIEQLTDRKVITYQSQILFNPDLVIEIFVFDKSLHRAAHEETAEAILGSGKNVHDGDEVEPVPDES